MSEPLALPAELTIYTVGELHPHWLAWLASRGDDDHTELDASAVAEVDGAGLQLLQSLAHALARQQRPLRLLRPSEVLQRACSALGLQALIADPAGACA